MDLTFGDDGYRISIHCLIERDIDLLARTGNDMASVRRMMEVICTQEDKDVTVGKRYFAKPRCLGFIQVYNDIGVWKTYPEAKFKKEEEK
jgi:hypothetical protein